MLSGSGLKVVFSFDIPIDKCPLRNMEVWVSCLSPILRKQLAESNSGNHTATGPQSVIFLTILTTLAQGSKQTKVGTFIDFKEL